MPPLALQLAPSCRPVALIPPPPAQISPLILADRLITLAQDAERAGHADMAVHLVSLVYSVFDDTVPESQNLAASWPRPVGKPPRQPGQLRRPNQGRSRPSQAEA